MPDDDTMLAQGTVRGWLTDEHGNVHGSITVEQISLCTNDPYCQADAAEHNPDCPIETQLREEFGF